MKAGAEGADWGWSRGRFWTVALALFILQGGLIWCFAERQHRLPRTEGPEMALRALTHPITQEQLATSFFAEDPTLFQAPSQNGFSGRAWMQTPPPQYHAAETPAPEAWLALSNSGWSPRLPAGASQRRAELALAAPATPEFEPTPVLTAAEKAPGTAMRIEGALRGRKLVSGAPAPGPQASQQLLSATVVQIAVDASGQVVTACVVGASGSPTADAMGLGMARRLRFAPENAPGAGPVWGRAVFSWETVEPSSLGK